MAGSVVLLLFVSWALTGAVNHQVPCVPDTDDHEFPAGMLNDLQAIVKRCGFIEPPDAPKVPSNYCLDLGSFQAGNQSGQPFSDPCKEEVTIEEVQLTLGPSERTNTSIIKSLRTNHSDGSVYSHGRPTDDVYTINFKRLKMFIIAAFLTTNDDGITAITFLAQWHNRELACIYGPVGVKTGDYQLLLGAANSFYGSVNEQGIIELGYHGCFPPQ